LKYLPEKLEESSTPGSNTHRSGNYNPHIFSSRAGKKHMMNGFFLMTKLAFGVPYKGPFGHIIFQSHCIMPN
jgi:hypothetical protein